MYIHPFNPRKTHSKDSCAHESNHNSGVLVHYKN